MLLEETQNPEAVKPFKLNWQEMEIKLAKGKFSFCFARPTAELILKRDQEIPSEIPIAKDRSYSLNAGSSEQDAIDAGYGEKCFAKQPEGYNGTVPKKHIAEAFRAIWRRSIFIPDHASAFDDIVEVWEVIGDVDNPTALIKHFIKQPDEKEMQKISNAINDARVAPAKNGKQKFVTKSALAKAMAFYRQHLDRVENAFYEETVDGAEPQQKFFSPEVRNEFINFVDALIQEMVIATFIREANDLLSD